jgi:hypothetical protein
MVSRYNWDYVREKGTLRVKVGRVVKRTPKQSPEL